MMNELCVPLNYTSLDPPTNLARPTHPLTQEDFDKKKAELLGSM